MNARRTIPKIMGAGLVALSLASCQHGKSLPAAPEFATAQRAAWSVVPADAQGGVVIADLSHFLSRLRALRATLVSGPVSRTYIDKGMATVTAELGFDPLDDGGWKKAGVDPAGPLLVILGEKSRVEVIFRAIDAATATATATKWYARASADAPPMDCAAAGALFRCGTPDWKLATDAAHSLWPHLEKNLPEAQRAMELVAYVPLDQGEAARELAKPNSPVKGMHAGYLGLTMSPERIVLRMGAKVEEAALVLPYLQPRQGTSLLGIAGGGVSATRMTFSPDLLLALLKSKLGDNFQTAAGAAQAATAIDLEKDVFDNMTGEIVSAGYVSDQKKDKDGKARSYRDRLSGALVVGMRDDERTKKLGDRLGQFLGGAMGTVGALGTTMGVTMSYRAEEGERKVHWFTFDLDEERAKTLGMKHLELFLTSIPGALAFGMGPLGLEEMRRRVGFKPAALLDTLPLPEEKALFASSPLVGWARAGQGNASRMELDAMKNTFAAAAPELGQGLVELMQLSQLVYDAVCAVEITNDRAELFYQITLL